MIITENVHQAIYFSDFTYFFRRVFGRLLHADEEAGNSETCYTSFYSTALHGDVQRLWKFFLVWEKLRPILDPIR